MSGEAVGTTRRPPGRPREAARSLIRENTQRLAEAIVAEWRRMAESEVWLSLPPAMDFDDLPEVLRCLGEAAFSPRLEAPLCRALAAASATHGHHRMLEGFQESYLLTEYHLLRRSMWNLLQRELEPDVAAAAILRIDALISLATSACLRGFHRPTYEERGEWPGALERLVEEWPLIGDG